MKSFMFVPSKPRMLGKIVSSDADAFIIDLEDSINEEDKEQALDDAYEFMATRHGKTVFVRLAGNHLEDELKKLKECQFAGYMIPKFENPRSYEQYTDYFDGKEIIALVETPSGIVNIKEIASSPFVSIIAFGAEDYTSSIGMKNCADFLNYSRSTIVTYGKAFGKSVIDTPSFIIDDMEALEKEIQISVDMGFDGKLAIHPKQVSKINEMFQLYDLGKMREVVAIYEASGQAVLRLDNQIYEKMHIAHFKRILKEHGIS